MEEALMKKRKGVTIIEFLVYLAIFSLIIMISMDWIVRLWQTCLFYSKKRVCLVNLSAAHDMLIRDLQNAPSSAANWKMKTTSQLIWTASTKKDICWMYENNTLVRIEGSYNEKKKQWKKKTKNLVASSIKKANFTCKEEGQIGYVDFTIADAYYTMNNSVMLLKRSLPWKEKEKDQQSS